MSVSLFDVQVGFGGAIGGSTDTVSADDLCAEMKRTSISRALVRIDPDGMVKDVPHSNKSLLAECSKHPGLVPCPIVVAQGGGGIASAAHQVDEAVAAGAGAVLIRPGADSWSLSAWASDDLFIPLQERRMPVICLDRMVDFEQVADMADRYPSLPFIVSEIGYRRQRIVVPLLKSFPNVYLSIGSNFTVHYGVEQIVREAGAERLLFGTGYPDTDGMPAITMLMYAEISDQERAAIGSGNLVQLIVGIQK